MIAIISKKIATAQGITIRVSGSKKYKTPWIYDTSKE
jgi:hypothetical protein